MERLHKVLAARGVASRRKAEQMIADGRVAVDGEIVRTLGFRVDPSRQKIEVDGKVVQDEATRYIILNKPSGYITTASDERGRRTVLDLVDVPERVVPVGRLDRPTSGLLLLTNDGELAFRITHPRFELEKEYEILLDGHPPRPKLDQLEKGVSVDGVVVRPEHVWAVKNASDGTILRVTIHEGRNRIVRRMMERIGYPVLKLERVRLGPLVLKGLRRGEWRDLTPGELQQLREAVNLPDEGGTERTTSSQRHSDRRRGRTEQNQERRKPRGQESSVRNRDRRSGGVREKHSRGRGRPST